MCVQAERTGNEGPIQRRQVSALFHLPASFFPVPSAAKPAQTVISPWTPGNEWHAFATVYHYKQSAHDTLAQTWAQHLLVHGLEIGGQ